MAKSYPTERVIETGADAAAACRLVRLLRASALAGGRHDPDLFDAAVLGHRRAETKARETLTAWSSGGRVRPMPARHDERADEQRAA